VTMKKRSAVIISIIWILAIIAIFSSVRSFPLKESDLVEDTLKRAGEIYNADISNYTVLDSRFSNNNMAFIYRFELEDETETSYAVSYYKHFLFPRYRISSFADYSRPDFGGILAAEGMPYNIVYDISGHSLEYKDSSLNNDLGSYLLSFIITVFTTVVFRIVLRIRARREP
jgi:hypothetical protein